MGKAGIERGALDAAVPTSDALGLLRTKCLVMPRRLPVVELMRGQGRSLLRKEAVMASRERDVPKPAEPLALHGGARKRAHHRPSLTGDVLEGLVQVEEAATLGDGRHTGSDGFLDRTAHIRVVAQLPRVKLGVTAT